jgi:Tfp pilus assembly protein PilF
MKLKMRFLPVLIATFLFAGAASTQHSSSPAGHVTLGIQLGLFYLFGHDAERAIRNLQEVIYLYKI